MVRLGTILAGLLFGFFLSRGRATDYDAIAGMFRFKDPHLPLLMATAIAVAGVGLALLRRFRPSVRLEKKPMHAGVIVGGLAFGIGWGVTGQCPGTALGQIGEGKVLAFVTVAGMLAGTWLFGLFAPRLAALQEPKPRPARAAADSTVRPA